MTKKMMGKLIAMGAREWTKGDMHRLYLGEAAEKLAGLEYTTYKGGQVSNARQSGETISIAQAGRIIAVADATYYDMVAGELVIQQPKGVKSYDFGKIKEMVEEAFAAMDADNSPEEDATTQIAVTYQGGESRTIPGKAIDYMLATVDGVELYAEAEPNDEWDIVPFAQCKASIEEQAASHGISIARLEF